MSKFIIGYGWSEIGVIEAASLEAAQGEAAKRSAGLGLLDEDLADTTWARIYSDDLAFELGLLAYSEPLTTRQAFHQSSPPPWRSEFGAG